MRTRSNGRVHLVLALLWRGEGADSREPWVQVDRGAVETALREQQALLTDLRDAVKQVIARKESLLKTASLAAVCRTRTVNRLQSTESSQFT